MHRCNHETHPQSVKSGSNKQEKGSAIDRSQHFRVEVTDKPGVQPTAASHGSTKQADARGTHLPTFAPLRT